MANQMIFKEAKIDIGDIIRVFQTMQEAEKEKSIVFEGRLIAIKGRNPNQMFTVRKIGADNVGVERVFPLQSPSISKIEVKKKIPARRAKLYYLRNQK